MSSQLTLEGGGGTNSDLTPAVNYNKEARGTSANTTQMIGDVFSGTDVITMAWSSRATYPSITDWPNGTYGGSVECSALGSLLSFKLQLVRVNSSGVVQETIQTGSSVSTTGVASISSTANPSSGAAGDRIQLRVLMTNSGGKGSTNFTFIFTTSTNVFISTPFTEFHWMNNTANGSFNDGRNWSLEQAPLAGDDVYFDGLFGTNPDTNCDYNSTVSLGDFFVTSGYTAQITQSVNAISNFLSLNGNYDANGFNVTCENVDCSGGATRTVDCGSGTWQVTDSTISLQGTGLTWNPETSLFIYAGNIAQNSGGHSMYDVWFGGGKTVTLSGVLTCHDIAVGVTGTSVINGADVEFTGDLTRTGDFTHDGQGKLVFIGSSGTQDWSMTGTAKFSQDIEYRQTGTAALTTTGNLYFDGDMIFTSLGSGGATVGAGTLDLNGTSNIASGGTAITWDDVDINTAGTVTLTDDFAVSGLLDITAGSTLAGGANTIFINAGDTTLNATGTFTKNTSTVDFTGSGCNITGDWDYYNLTLNPSSNVTVNTAATLTVDASGTFTATATSGNEIIFKSSVDTVQFDFDLSAGATQDVDYVIATDVDSSGGLMIFDVNGTITNCINWVSAYGSASLMNDKNYANGLYVPTIGRGQ